MRRKQSFEEKPIGWGLNFVPSTPPYIAEARDARERGGRNSRGLGDGRGILPVGSAVKAREAGKRESLPSSYGQANQRIHEASKPPRDGYYSDGGGARDYVGIAEHPRPSPVAEPTGGSAMEGDWSLAEAVRRERIERLRLSAVVREMYARMSDGNGGVDGSRVEQLEGAVTRLHGTALESDRAAKEALQTAKEAEGTLEDTRARVTSHTRALEILREATQNLRREVSEAQQGVSNDISEIRGTVDGMEGRLSALANDLSYRSEELRKLSSLGSEEAAVAAATRSALEDRIEELQRSLDELSVRTDAAEAARGKSDKDGRNAVESLRNLVFQVQREVNERLDDEVKARWQREEATAAKEAAEKYHSGGGGPGGGGGGIDDAALKRFTAMFQAALQDEGKSRRRDVNDLRDGLEVKLRSLQRHIDGFRREIDNKEEGVAAANRRALSRLADVVGGLENGLERAVQSLTAKVAEEAEQRSSSDNSLATELKDRLAAVERVIRSEVSERIKSEQSLQLEVTNRLTKERREREAATSALNHQLKAVDNTMSSQISAVEDIVQRGKREMEARAVSLSRLLESSVSAWEDGLIEAKIDMDCALSEVRGQVEVLRSRIAALSSTIATKEDMAALRAETMQTIEETTEITARAIDRKFEEAVLPRLEATDSRLEQVEASHEGTLKSLEAHEASITGLEDQLGALSEVSYHLEVVEGNQKRAKQDIDDLYTAVELLSKAIEQQRIDIACRDTLKDLVERTAEAEEVAALKGTIETLEKSLRTQESAAAEERERLAAEFKSYVDEAVSAAVTGLVDEMKAKDAEYAQQIAKLTAELKEARADMVTHEVLAEQQGQWQTLFMDMDDTTQQRSKRVLEDANAFTSEELLFHSEINRCCRFLVDWVADEQRTSTGRTLGERDGQESSADAEVPSQPVGNDKFRRISGSSEAKEDGGDDNF